MNSSNNPLDEHILSLYRQLNILWGLFLILEKHLKEHLSDVQRQFRSHKDFENLKHLPFSGSSIVITDLTGETDKGWLKHKPTGAFRVRVDEIEKASDEIISRNASLTVSQGYERFETFLYDTVACYLHRKPEEAKPEHLKDCDRKRKNKKDKCKQCTANSEDINYWKNFVRCYFRSSNNQKILSFLRDTAAGLKEAEVKNTRQINLQEWYDMVSEVRHAATHSNFVVKKNRISNWNSKRTELFLKQFPANYDSESDGYELRLTLKNAKDATRLFCEYGLQIYKTVSLSCGYDLVQQFYRGGGSK